MKKISIILLLSLINTAYAVRGDVLGFELIPNELKLGVVQIVKLRGDEYTHSCTGTIIDTKTVLTAAHCFDDKVTDIKINYKNDVYLPSSIRLSSEYKRADLVDPYWQYVYDIKIENDFALITVNESFDEVDIVDFYTGNLDEDYESELLISGYGQVINVFGMGEGQGVYRVSTPTQLTSYTSDRIRIEDGYTGACLGDSGGPLWIKAGNKWTQLAVISQGDCSTFGLFEVINIEKIYKYPYISLDL